MSNQAKIVKAIQQAKTRHKALADEAAVARRIGVSETMLATIKKNGTQEQRILNALSDASGMPVAQLK